MGASESNILVDAGGITKSKRGRRKQATRLKTANGYR